MHTDMEIDKNMVINMDANTTLETYIDNYK